MHYDKFPFIQIEKNRQYANNNEKFNILNGIKKN